MNSRPIIINDNLIEDEIIDDIMKNYKALIIRSLGSINYEVAHKNSIPFIIKPYIGNDGLNDKTVYIILPFIGDRIDNYVLEKWIENELLQRYNDNYYIAWKLAYKILLWSNN